MNKVQHIQAESTGIQSASRLNSGVFGDKQANSERQPTYDMERYTGFLSEVWEGSVQVAESPGLSVESNLSDFWWYLSKQIENC